MERMAIPPRSYCVRSLAMYNYKGKYMLTGTFRADGSSKFQKKNKWDIFSVSSCCLGCC